MTGQMMLPGIDPPEFPQCQRTCAAFEDDGIGFQNWGTGRRAGPRCRVTDWRQDIDERGTVHFICRRYEA